MGSRCENICFLFAWQKILKKLPAKQKTYFFVFNINRIKELNLEYQ